MNARAQQTCSPFSLESKTIGPSRFSSRLAERYHTLVIYQKKANQKHDIRSYIILEQDSLHDVSILLKANLPYLPCLASNKRPTPESLASQVVERSGGYFL